MSLSNYIQQPMSDLLKNLGAFYAFSDEQLNKAKVEGVEYVAMGGGLIAPKENARALHDGIIKITDDGIKHDLETNGKEKIIIRELYNYECFYTGELTRCVEALEDYGITYDDVKAVFNVERYNAKC